MATTDAPEIYLAPSDVAERLQLDPSAPIRWIRKGVLLADGSRLRLRHIRTPGGYRIKESWLDAFLQAIADDRASKVHPAPKAGFQSARVAKMDGDLAAAGFVR